MSLNAVPSCANSSLPRTSTRASARPLASSREAVVRRRRGRTMRVARAIAASRATARTATSASTIRPPPARSTHDGVPAAAGSARYSSAAGATASRNASARTEVAQPRNRAPDAAAVSTATRAMPTASKPTHAEAPEAVVHSATPELVDAAAPPPPDRLRAAVEGDVDMLFVVLGGIALLAGAIGIANVTLLSVLERAAEIGLRRALGARPRNIAGQFVTESGIVGALGGLLGGTAGLLTTLGVAAAQEWTPVIDLRVVLAAPALGLAVGVVAGVFPAWHAARIEPVEALRR